MKVKLKSAYLPAGTDDGVRYLVETLWPEGLETQSLSPYQWVHELAPSYDLKEMAIEKHWEPEKFRDEYLRELQEPQRRAWFNRIVKEAEDGDEVRSNRVLIAPGGFQMKMVQKNGKVRRNQADRKPNRL